MTSMAGSLGVVGGSGWLGAAFADAVVSAGFVPPERLLLSYRTRPPRADRLPAAKWMTDCQAIVDGAEIVVVSVRPEQFGSLHLDARGKTVVSFMAGVQVDRLAEALKTSSIVRAMPNAALGIRRSYTPWYAAPGVSAEAKRVVGAMLAAGGEADEVPSEDQIEYFTGMSGSGPAYPALLADALVRDAVARGIDPEVARRAAVAVVAGASQLLADGGAPADVVDAFVQYGGTTAAAIDAMVAGGFRSSVAEGLGAALDRAHALGRPA